MTSERTGGRFDVVRKDALASPAGVRYRDSRRTLTPRFGVHQPVPAWPLAAAWALGLVVFFPFFPALRQLLEHRDDMADRRVDYHRGPTAPSTASSATARWPAP